MIFNGIEKDYIVPLTGRRRSAWAPISRNLISVTGMPGAHLSHTDVQARVITVPILVKAKNINDLQKLKEDMAEWLVHDEPKELVFKDEPDRVYYALVDGELELDEIFSTGRGEITFICPDPYKYGPEKTVETTSDEFIIENEGTAEAEPIIELTATQKATFAMVSNGEEYMMIGKPAEVDQQIVDEKNVVLDEVGDTIDTWQPAPDYNGTFVHGSQGIQVGDWGSGTGWHGPGAIKEIDPIQDFEIEFFVYVRSETPDRTFAITTNFFDEHMNELGMMRLWDNSDRVLRKVVEARVGPYVGDFVNYLISSRNYDLREQRVWGGIIRVIRKGNVYTFYAARITQAGKHVDTITQTFRDINNEYGGKLKFVRIDIRNYGNTEKPNEVAINRIRVWEHNEVLVDETPYIVYPGDIIEFDHVTKDIRLNGESRKDLKAFGGSFFTLKKGINTLTITPENTFDTVVKYRERFR